MLFTGNRLEPPAELVMQTDRSRLRELEIRVANPQHWSAGEHQINVENLRQLRFRLDDQLKRLRQQQAPALSGAAITLWLRAISWVRARRW